MKKLLLMTLLLLSVDSFGMKKDLKNYKRLCFQRYKRFLTALTCLKKNGIILPKDIRQKLFYTLKQADNLENQIFEKGSSILDRAIQADDINTVKFLIARGAHMHNIHPLTISMAIKNNPEILYLLKKVADQYVRSNKAELLHYACIFGSSQAVEILLKDETDPDKLIWYERTPLMSACRRGQVEVVKILLPLKPVLNITYRGRTILQEMAIAQMNILPEKSKEFQEIRELLLKARTKD